MSEYEELVELGFEGIDRFAEHFHDPVFGYVRKLRSSSPRDKKKDDPVPDQRQKGQQREVSKKEKSPRRDSHQLRESAQQPDLPPHPQWQVPPPPPGPPPSGLSYTGQIPPESLPTPPGQPPRRQLLRQRSYSEPNVDHYASRFIPDDRHGSDANSDIERGSRSMDRLYAPDRRRYGDWRDDDRYERTVEDREYYGPNGTAQQIVMRTRDANRYQQEALVPRAPSPPPGYGYARGYEDAWAVRGRPMPRRQRSSSWSPPRRPERRRDSPPRRVRSKSPNHHRALAVVVGALVGGMAGSRVKKDQPGANTVATVGGAILGGIAGREIEQEYDRHKDRRAHHAFERGEAREKRRLEREYDYD